MKLIQRGNRNAKIMLVGEAPIEVLALVPDRIRRKIKPGPDPDSCWEWLGAHGGSHRTGQVWWEGKVQPIHRVLYELLCGPIASGLEPDHLCRNHSCCNPAHIEPVTHSENVKRGAAYHHVVLRWLTATYCQRGHPFDGDNTYVEPNGKRRCLECKRERQRKWRAAKRLREMEDLRCV